MRINKPLALFMSIIIALNIVPTIPVYSENVTSLPNESAVIVRSEPETLTEEPILPMINLPDNLRGAVITPGVDFIFSDEDTEDDIIRQINEIMENASKIGLNTLIINTANDERCYYNLDMNKTDEVDYISLAVEKAHEGFFNVFLVYDINMALGNAKRDFNAINKLVSEIHRFSIKYLADGIILDDYYTKKNSETYGRYMLNGSGIGFENWLYDSTEYLFETAGRVIRMTDNSIPVGIMINDVWANNKEHDEGSETNDALQALYDGFSDTKKYIENKYADFLLLRSYGALDDNDVGFETLTGWWGELCLESGLPMYVIHHNEKIGTDAPGWGAEDQLLKQLVKAKETPSYKGSVFNSFGSLLANPMNTTATITKYYENQINEETLDEELTMRSPKDLRFTTYEKTVDFAGSFDENFDVYFNNKKIKLNEAGNFYFEKQLTIGQNIFTIKHKSKTYTYQIERKIITMRELDSSIADGKILRVDGGTSITLSAVAYKGANVTATVNGKAIALKEAQGSNDDSINSSYETFSGIYKVPEGIIEKEQPLGKIAVTASYQGYSRTLNGANIIVNALPKPEPPKKLETKMFDQDNIGSGEVVGTISPFKTEDDIVKYIRVINNNTTVFDGKTIGTLENPAFNPLFGQLPAGTLDYLKNSHSNFYTTMSGKRFYTTDVTVFEDTGLGENKLVVKASGTNRGDSYLKIGLDYKSSYRLQLVGQSYYNDDGYNVSNFSPADYVYITFDNVTSVTKLPSFESNLVFDAGRWEQVTIDGVPKFRLVLRLRQGGVYGGNSAYYDGSGDLMLTFQVLTKTIQNMNIVIDPGHGYGKSADTLDPGAIGHVIEHDVNVAIAKKLEAKLKAMGVNAVRLKTESNFILTKSRPVIARDYGCDLFISIHANKVAGDDSVRGTEVYYHTPFSQPLAKEISASISNYFTNSVYKDGAVKNRGDKYSYFNVALQHDFPSVLVETGFVSNMEDAMALANDKHQSGIADSIIKGINNYLAKSTISYSSNGSASIPDNNGDFEEGSLSIPDTTDTPSNTEDSAEVSLPPDIESHLTEEDEAEEDIEEVESEEFLDDEYLDELDEEELEEL